jgi:hypothetical protein
MRSGISSITLSGTSIAMGQAFGENFRPQIHEFAASRLARLQAFVFEYTGMKMNRKDILHLLKPVLCWHGTYNKNVWDEFCGIAAGANISNDMLMIAMSFTDLQDYLVRHTMSKSPVASEAGGCSAFLVPDRLSTEGSLCGQTWDMSPEAINFLVLVRRKPSQGPETLYLTTMGCLALIGLNSEGIAIGNTNLMTSDHAPGVNYLFSITAALQATSLNAATGIIINTPRLSGHNFYLADQHNTVNIECSATQAYCTTVRDLPFVHTNHCLNRSLQSLELPRSDLLKESSHYRYKRMQKQFAKKVNWNADRCWKILSDKKASSTGAAICRLDDGKALFTTVATILLLPRERKIWVCAGGATQKNRQEISL